MIVFAIGAHPDDIEIYMAGTLLRLKNKGAEVHMWNLANGSCGTTSYNKDEIIKIRQNEAKAAADLIGATLHPPIVDDLEIFYQSSLIQRVAAKVRLVHPSILLVPSFDDYMEDHSNTARIVVTAAFARGMPNYPTLPNVTPWLEDVAIYHAQPRANETNMRQFIRPSRYVDITSVLEQKKAMVSCHKSQQPWLDQSQGFISMEVETENRAHVLGRMSGQFLYAEGWRQHASGGFASPDYDPMKVLLRQGYWDDMESDT